MAESTMYTGIVPTLSQVACSATATRKHRDEAPDSADLPLVRDGIPERGRGQAGPGHVRGRASSPRSTSTLSTAARLPCDEISVTKAYPIVSRAAKPAPAATPISRPSEGRRYRCSPISRIAGTMSFAASSMNPTATSRQHTEIAQRVVLEKARGDDADHPRQERDHADRAAGDVVRQAPAEDEDHERRRRDRCTQQDQRRHEIRVLVLINTRRTISNSTTPPTSTRTQAHRRVMPTSPPPGSPKHRPQAAIYPSNSSTKHHRQDSPGSADCITGCPVRSKCTLACLGGDESQQPTWPQVRQTRRCTHGPSSGV